MPSRWPGMLEIGRLIKLRIKSIKVVQMLTYQWAALSNHVHGRQDV